MSRRPSPKKKAVGAKAAPKKRAIVGGPIDMIEASLRAELGRSPTKTHRLILEVRQTYRHLRRKLIREAREARETETRKALVSNAEKRLGEIMKEIMQVFMLAIVKGNARPFQDMADALRNEPKAPLSPAHGIFLRELEKAIQRARDEGFREPIWQDDVAASAQAQWEKDGHTTELKWGKKARDIGINLPVRKGRPTKKVKRERERRNKGDG